MTKQVITGRPLVSIIVTNHNYRRFLPDCLDSACGQTYPVLEVIVVDDGSSDDSRSFLAAYQRPVHILHQPRAGQPAAYNRGFQASRGTIVIFLDADDTLYADAVEQVVGAWHSGLSKCHFRLARVDLTGQPLGVTVPPRSRRLPAGDLRPELQRTGRYTSPPGSGNAYGRTFLARVMPMPVSDQRLVADGYVLTLAPLYGTVAALDMELGTYRIHAAGLSGSGALQPATFAVKTANEICLQAELARHLGEQDACAGQLRSRRDLLHLEHRLISFRLVPRLHPVAGDRRWRLLRCGWLAVVADPELSGRERPVRLLLLLLIVCAPLTLLLPLLRWRYIVPEQPATLRRLMCWLTARQQSELPNPQAMPVRP